MKNIQTREQSMLARLRELNWQTSGKIKQTYLSGRFCFHVLENMAQNNNKMIVTEMQNFKNGIQVSHK